MKNLIDFINEAYYSKEEIHKSQREQEQKAKGKFKWFVELMDNMKDYLKKFKLAESDYNNDFSEWGNKPSIVISFAKYSDLRSKGLAKKMLSYLENLNIKIPDDYELINPSEYPKLIVVKHKNYSYDRLFETRFNFKLK